MSRLLVCPGDKIKKNEPLFVIEAMKMESIVESPFEGIIANTFLENGSIVEQNDLILEIKEIKQNKTVS